MKNFSIIVAVDSENGIGKDNQLAWYLPDDVKYFSRITTKPTNPVNKTP
jgi:dihydrofolate reductase